VGISGESMLAHYPNQEPSPMAMGVDRQYDAPLGL
jgi:hypothetical protein